MKREHTYLILIVLLVGFLIYVMYPFYQRYWASLTYGEGKEGKRYVENLETIAYGLTFKDAETLATELKKPALSRKAPDILNPAQFGPKM